MPSADRLDKRITLGSRRRIAMLNLMHATTFANNPRLKVSDFELRLPVPGSTYQTFAMLRSTFPDTTFWFAFGMDAYRSMPEWPHGLKLQQKLPMVLFGSGPLPANTARLRYIQLDDAFADMSSTRVRSTLAAGEPIDAMVSPPIAAYLSVESPSLRGKE